MHFFLTRMSKNSISETSSIIYCLLAKNKKNSTVLSLAYMATFELLSMEKDVLSSQMVYLHHLPAGATGHANQPNLESLSIPAGPRLKPTQTSPPLSLLLWPSSLNMTHCIPNPCQSWRGLWHCVSLKQRPAPITINEA